MRTQKDLDEFHQQNVLKYVGKQTDKGVVEGLRYFTFRGATGGIYSDKPELNCRGIIYATINDKNIAIGELTIKL